MKEKGKKKSIVIGVTSLLLVTLILLGLTYAYYKTRIVGNSDEKSVSVVSKNLKLKYVNGSSIVSGTEEIVPGYTVTKTFSVENIGDEIEYGIYLEDVVNEFVNKEDVIINITCTSKNTETSEESGTCSGLSDYQFPEVNEKILTNTIGEGKTHEYSLTLEYKNSETKDQSDDIGKLLGGKIQVHAINGSFDLLLNIGGLDSTDIAILSSNPQQARNHNNVYKFTGIELGQHSLKITDSEGNEKNTINFEIVNGETFNLSNNKIYIPSGTDTFQLNAKFSADGITIKSSGEVLTDDSAFKVGNESYSAENLLEALNASSESNPVVLQSNVDLASNIVIAAEENATLKEYYLDLGGFQLSCEECMDTLFKVRRHNTTLNVFDGSILVRGDYSAFGIGSLVKNSDGTTDTTDQNIKLNIASSVEITGENGGLYILGTGSQIDFAGKLNILGKDGTGFSGNGGSVGGVINILPGAEITALEAGSYALYLPFNGTTNISGGTIKGSTPILIKAGAINMTGGTLKAYGEKNYYITSSCTTSDINYMTGDAILVQVHDAYLKNLSINISGTADVTSENGNIIRVYGCKLANPSSSENTVTVTGKYTTETIDESFSNTKLYN